MPNTQALLYALLTVLRGASAPKVPQARSPELDLDFCGFADIPAQYGFTEPPAQRHTWENRVARRMRQRSRRETAEQKTSHWQPLSIAVKGLPPVAQRRRVQAWRRQARRELHSNTPVTEDTTNKQFTQANPDLDFYGTISLPDPDLLF